MESSGTKRRGSRRQKTQDAEAVSEQMRAIDEQRRQMALRHVRQYPDPVLRVPAVEVVEFDAELEALAERMVSIMSDAHGIGLAAPQLGLRLRIFTYQPEEGPAEAVVNPTITSRSDETSVAEEGCLSLGDVPVLVERPVAVTVEGFDVSGAPHTWEFEAGDWYARVFQHEIDHLDGVLMIDRAAAGESRPQP